MLHAMAFAGQLCTLIASTDVGSMLHFSNWNLCNNYEFGAVGLASWCSLMRVLDRLLQYAMAWPMFYVVHTDISFAIFVSLPSLIIAKDSCSLCLRML